MGIYYELLPFPHSGSWSTPTMDGRNKPGRQHTLQIYRLMHDILENDKEQIEKMLHLGLDDLINFTEPQEGKGVLHVAVPTNKLGDGPIFHYENKQLHSSCLAFYSHSTLVTVSLVI